MSDLDIISDVAAQLSFSTCILCRFKSFRVSTLYDQGINTLLVYSRVLTDSIRSGQRKPRPDCSKKPFCQTWLKSICPERITFFTKIVTLC